MDLMTRADLESLAESGSAATQISLFMPTHGSAAAYRPTGWGGRTWAVSSQCSPSRCAGPTSRSCSDPPGSSGRGRPDLAVHERRLGDVPPGRVAP